MKSTSSGRSRALVQRLRRRGLVALVLSAIAVAGAGSCGDWVTTEAQARSLADSELARYAVRVGLPLSAFDPPEATTDGPHRWVFVYRSRTAPPRRLRVRVGGRGRVEPSAESE